MKSDFVGPYSKVNDNENNEALLPLLSTAHSSVESTMQSNGVEVATQRQREKTGVLFPCLRVGKHVVHACQCDRNVWLMMLPREVREQPKQKKKTRGGSGHASLSISCWVNGWS